MLFNAQPATHPDGNSESCQRITPETLDSTTSHPKGTIDTSNFPDISLQPEFEKPPDLTTNDPEPSITPHSDSNSPSNSQEFPDEITPNLSPNFQNDENPKKKKGWTKQDDELLLDLGMRYKNDWKKISRRFFSLRQIRKAPSILKRRYKEIKTPTIGGRARFTHEDDLGIVKGIMSHGKNWIKISEDLKGFDPIMIKNRFYSHIKKKELMSKLESEIRNESSPKDNHKLVVEKKVVEKVPEKIKEIKQPTTIIQPIPQMNNVIPQMNNVIPVMENKFMGKSPDLLNGQVPIGLLELMEMQRRNMAIMSNINPILLNLLTFGRSNVFF